MTKKMYANLQEKYKTSVFQILNRCKALSNFDFNSTVRKSTLGFAIVWIQGHRKVFIN